MAQPTLLLDAQLKALRLPTFLREYDKVARQCAQEGLDCPRYLLRLCVRIPVKVNADSAHCERGFRRR